ncbi:hypothetical protein ACFLZH_00450 [Patescibacteria group bacterium]
MSNEKGPKDTDCYYPPACGEQATDDGIDNDADGLTDCADSECVGQTGPGGIICEATESSCSDGGDNDGDGDTDCTDTDCYYPPACGEQATDDGIDNDADGLTDCDDADCDGFISYSGVCTNGESDSPRLNFFSEPNEHGYMASILSTPDSMRRSDLLGDLIDTSDGDDGYDCADCPDVLDCGVDVENEIAKRCAAVCELDPSDDDDDECY